VNESPEWFAPKRYGYGSALPISWQGWLIYIGYLSIVIGSAFFLVPRSLPAFGGLVASLTLALILITRRTTRGGWRWRWGDDE
jgi:hypothetical protein